MLKRKNIYRALIFAMIISILAACGGRETLKVEPIPVTADPAAEVNNLEREVSNGRMNQLNILTPTSFKNADGYYNESRSMLEKGGEISKILEKVALARAELKRASEQALIVRSALGEAIEARDSALEAGAASLGPDFDEVEGRFLELTGDVEKNNMKRADRNKKGVAEDFRKLEVRAIKVQLLGETRKLIDQAKKMEAERFAPATFKEAQEKLNEADRFISENPYVKEKRNQLAAEALFLSQRSIQITEQSKKAKDMKPEEISLWVEGVLHDITSELAAPDMRNEKFVTQVENIIESIEALNADQKFLALTVKSQKQEMKAMKENYQNGIEAMVENHRAELQGLEKQIATLEGLSREEQMEKERLAAESRAAEAKLAAEKLEAERKLAEERQFNEKFNEIQGYFYEDEAEVYKKGNKLIIRLKGIKFPVGKAVIMPNNYELLSKVQRAIRSFGEPFILIEGHTDSTGSNLVNERLSMERAQSVGAYLLANDVVPEDKITALGYGSERPIASNETEEGKAKNRRIDIIVTPQPRAG